MDSRIDADVAREQFGEIIDLAVRDNQRFIVERVGEPAVVIMSVLDFIRTVAPPPEWLTRMWADAKRHGLDNMSMEEIDAEIAAARRELSSSGQG